MKIADKLKWAKFTMFLAAAYNLFWGAIISIYPQIILFGNPSTDFLLIILRCVGMLVGVYGIAYYFASGNPVAYWPLIFVGWLGKLLGPIGSVYYILMGKLTPAFLWVNLWNDIIWLYPFGWIIYMAVKQKLNIKESNAGTLYQQLLGNNFDNLSPNLRAFHSAAKSIRVVGEFKVSRGDGFINNLFANLVDLPQASPAAFAELIVTPNEDHEIWSRRLGGKQVISKQWLHGSLLVERFKLLNIYLKAEVVTGDLLIYDISCTVLGIPLPPFFTPTVTATGKDAGDCILIEVEIGFKPFGRIINYRGMVKPVVNAENTGHIALTNTY